MQESRERQGADNRFGSLCLTLGFLSYGNLCLALEEQTLLRVQGRQVRIGNLLVEAGMISNGEKDEVLTTQEELRSRVYIL